jgi:glycosyltransferase involved in cell wall biosynthesis
MRVGRQQEAGGEIAVKTAAGVNELAANRSRFLQAGFPGSESQFSTAILTGGGDKPYALGLAFSLIAEGINFEFIASDDLDVPELREDRHVRVLNLRGAMRSDVGRLKKAFRVFVYYWRLITYAATAKPKLFHLLWNNKFAFVDRVLLMLYYRGLGKRIVLTVHNVNAGWRDGRDTFLNRLTLKIQYLLCHHLFVHTTQMSRELTTHFEVSPDKITVIPFGINSTVPNTQLNPEEARQRLGLNRSHKTLLFFGNIAPYKGLEYLVEAMRLLVLRGADYRLVIAGRPKNCEAYWTDIQQRMSSGGLDNYIVKRIEYIADQETEIYFKAADVVVLPYTHIFQSGVLFLGYNFGLPAVACDVGSLKEDVIEGKTGFTCPPCDPVSLAKTIETYFSSELYQRLDTVRSEIAQFAAAKYSWKEVSKITQRVYKNVGGLKLL